MLRNMLATDNFVQMIGPELTVLVKVDQCRKAYRERSFYEPNAVERF